MESRAKLMGHPAHPMFIVFPLGLLVSSVVFDGLYAATSRPEFALVAFWDIALGILTGVIAGAIGLVDFLAIPSRTRANRIAWMHGVGNVVVLALFAASWWIRRTMIDNGPDLMAQWLSIAGVALGAVTGWWGGELVDRLGVGVDDGANLNAPSSLRRPVGEQGDTTKHKYA